MKFDAIDPPACKIAVLTPVLEDWQSLEKLISDIGAQPALSRCDVTVIAVDDGSAFYDPPSADLLEGPIHDIRVVRLKANLSHQRAIALGLCYVQRDLDVDVVIVMDSDGEDRPSDIELLLEASRRNEGKIVVAERRRRSEGLRFRIGYAVYKMIFSLVTGRSISFGNFALIPVSRLKNVIYNPNIWNSFAATLLRSRVPIDFVGTNRGNRYFGRSHMSFSNLVVHGMSAIAVFSDVVIVRMIIGLVLAGILFVAVTAAIVIFKLIVDYYGIPGLFLPGYATNLILSLANIMVSAMFIGFVGVLTLLASRVHAAAMPSTLLDEMVDTVDRIVPGVLAERKSK